MYVHVCIYALKEHDDLDVEAGFTVRLYVCMYVCMYLCMYVCIYVL